MESIPNKKIDITNVLLEEIAYAMNSHDYESAWYLDLLRGETRIVTDDVITGEDEELDEEEEMDEERFIPIPEISSREGWQQMEDFIYLQKDLDDVTRDLLLTNIEGRGAFSRFKDSFYRLNLIDQWYEYKGREDRKIVLDWLYSLDLISEKDTERGLQLYEEALIKQKKRKEDLQKMVPGNRVKCSSNSGHENKLTVGKAYKVLDERKEHLNIRLRDDRGKICWFPKSHFELLES
jgi:hypothetical protein